MSHKGDTWESAQLRGSHLPLRRFRSPLPLRSNLFLVFAVVSVFVVVLVRVCICVLILVCAFVFVVVVVVVVSVFGLGLAVWTFALEARFMPAAPADPEGDAR